MSGIYGLYRYDGAPVDLNWLERMRAAMAYYGPDGGDCRVEGPLALGHLLLKVNPEDAFDNQPVRVERGIVVSAARLDNRDALFDSFKITAADAARTTDGHLVSLAFERWGEEVCSHLQGDWALAAWDAKERRLLLARDALGNSPFYYYQGKGYIGFASSLKALLAIPGIIKEPDRLRLAEVLVSWQHDAELTAYKDFRRLVRAHAMSIDSIGQFRIWSHWSPLGREMLRYPRDEEYVEEFLQHYTKAVQNSLRTQKPLAAQLSGGRDSGSVVVLAASLLAGEGRSLSAYTSVPHFPPDGADERRLGNEWNLAHATADMAGNNVRHIAIDAGDYGLIQCIQNLLDIHEGPTHAPSNHVWLRAITEAAVQNGAGVVLTGEMGNGTVSWLGNGSALLALSQANPRAALRLFLYASPNPWLIVKRQILKPFLNPALRAFRRYRLPQNVPWQSYSAISAEMASALKLNDRMQAAEYDPTFTNSPLKDFRPNIIWSDHGIGASISAESAAWHSLSNIDPTSNLSLMEFLLRVPDDQFRRGDNGSWLFRRTFRNRMPEQVLTNQRKGFQGADVGHRILRELSEFRECLSTLDSLPEARQMLDLPLLHRCLEDLVIKVDPVTTINAISILLRGLGVGLFLRRLAGSDS